MAIVGLGGEKLWLCPSLNDNPHDISGNGNNGTYNGGMGTVADVTKGGKRAYSFDGVDDYIDLTTSNVASSQNLNSFSLWINPDSINSVAVIINAGNASNGDRFINLGINGTQNILCGRSNDWLVAGNHSTSNWYHLCVISNGTTISLYKDGLLIGSRTDATVNFTETKCRIGGFILNTSNQYDGLMDDIRIFDRALTTAEIKHLAKARGITGTPLKKGLGDEKLWLCPSVDDSAEDLSGNGNNGTYNGGMGTVADSSNGGSRAYSFDGVNDRIDCPADTLGGSSTLSVSCWVYQDSYDATKGNAFVAQVDVGSNAEKIFVLYTPASVAGKAVRSIIYTNTSGSFAEAYWGSPPPPLNAWHHWCMTADGSTIRLYKDGVLVDSTAYSGSPPTSPTTALEIGRYKGGGNNDDFCLDGKMDDIRVFTRALTPTEITHLASARGVAGSPYGFKGLGGEKLWLCPTLDDSAEDISGNRNHGVYQGNATTVTDTSNGGSKAYSFATGGDCIVHDQFGGPLSESQTVSWWSKHNGTSRVHQISCTVHEPAGYIGGSNNRWLYEVFNNTTERFWPSSSSNHNVTRSTANTWRHNCWIRDNGSGDSLFYVDGVLDITVTPPSIYDADTNISNLLVGLAGGNPTVDLYIDDVRTFGRALTQEEVTHLAKSRGVLGSPHNLNGIVHLLSSFIHPFT
jgi:hypothetical protein